MPLTACAATGHREGHDRESRGDASPTAGAVDAPDRAPSAAPVAPQTTSPRSFARPSTARASARAKGPGASGQGSGVTPSVDGPCDVEAPADALRQVAGVAHRDERVVDREPPHPEGGDERGERRRAPTTRLAAAPRDVQEAAYGAEKYVHPSAYSYDSSQPAECASRSSSPRTPRAPRVPRLRRRLAPGRRLLRAASAATPARSSTSSSTARTSRRGVRETHGAFVLRDLALALVDLARRPRGKATVRFYDEPWELCVERFGAAACLSVYRTGPEPHRRRVRPRRPVRRESSPPPAPRSSRLLESRTPLAAGVDAGVSRRGARVGPRAAACRRAPRRRRHPEARVPERSAPSSWSRTATLPCPSEPSSRSASTRAADGRAHRTRYEASLETVERSDMHALLFRGKRARGDPRALESTSASAIPSSSPNGSSSSRGAPSTRGSAAWPSTRAATPRASSSACASRPRASSR